MLSSTNGKEAGAVDVNGPAVSQQGSTQPCAMSCRCRAAQDENGGAVGEGEGEGKGEGEDKGRSGQGGGQRVPQWEDVVDVVDEGLLE